MTPRPIHRWKSFWLGILVVCCLAWAWRDSRAFVSWVAWGPVNVGNGCGAVHVSYDSRVPVSREFEGARLDFEKTFFNVEVPAFLPPLLLRGGGRLTEELLLEAATLAPDQGPSGTLMPFSEFLEKSFADRPRADWMILVPHWLVMLGSGVPWAGFLLWRWRRMRRPTGSAEFIPVHLRIGRSEREPGVRLD